jgi:hypothetical protein
MRAAMNPAVWEDDDERAGYARTSWTYLWEFRMTLGDYRTRQPGRVRGQRLPSTLSKG